MMTLDEAIRQAEARAAAPGYTEESRQLAEWLKELKKLRSFYADVSQAVDTMTSVWRAMGKDYYDIFYKRL